MKALASVRAGKKPLSVSMMALLIFVVGSPNNVEVRQFTSDTNGDVLLLHQSSRREQCEYHCDHQETNKI